MSPMISLANRLLETGRNLHKMGRHTEAHDILKRLSGFRKLPAAVAGETQACLASILMAGGKYVPARRHLAAALLYRPDHAAYHHMMAVALDADDEADPDRALDSYRKALQHDPDNPEYLCEFGLLAICLGHTDEGLAALRQAVDLAPEDPAVVDHLVEGLVEAEQPQEARLALRAALFRNPRDGRFRGLWNRFQFRRTCEQQASERLAKKKTPTTKGPALLSFAKAQARRVVGRVDGQTVWSDEAHPLTPPHRPLRTNRPNHRNAQ